ncbi:MAG: zinc-binding dehydrogenase, partial [Pseudomonadota bacterium]
GGEGQSLLIVGAAGGVGSIAIQLARALTGLTIIATASRPETRDWVTSLGAHHVVDHRGDLASAVTAVALGGVDYVFSTNATEQHWPALVEVAAPQARLGIIDDPSSLDPTLLKMKSLSLSWEFMFTRSMHATPDMAEQGRLLTRLAGLVDDGRVRSTLADVPGTLSVDTLRDAHARLERGTARGKIVLTVN